MKAFTKSISLLMVLILCLTVGGVYAAWSYAASAGVSETVNKAVSITEATQSGTLGSYQVLYQDFSLIIDQTAEGDYTPILKFFPANDTNGDLTFKFTPNATASDEIKNNGMDSTVSFSSTLTHGGTALFAFPETLSIGKVGSGASYVWVKQSDGSFTCTIPNADLGNFIQLNYTEKLDTFAKYQAFESSLENGTVVIKIANAAAS